LVLTVGQILHNRYRIQGVIKQGGRSAVYSAWDSSLDTKVAIKEIISTDSVVAQQFKSEARLLATLRQSNLPYVIDHFSIPGGDHFLVTEFIEGRDLQSMIDQTGKPFPLSQVQTWLSEVGEGLAFLHFNIPPIIHRDVKPANILINSRGEAILVGFGVGRVSDPSQNATIATASKSAAYFSPEMLEGSIDARADIYSLGATFYTLVTGTPPINCLKRKAGQFLTPPNQLNPTIPPSIDDMVMKAMELDPNRRFRNIEEMLGIMRAAEHETQLGGRSDVAAKKVLTLEPESSKKRQTPWLIALVAGSVILCILLSLVGGLGIYTYMFKATSTQESTQTMSPSQTIIVLTSPSVESMTPTPAPEMETTLTPTPTNTPISTIPIVTTYHPTETTETIAATSTESNLTWMPCPGIYASRLHVGDQAFVSYNPPLANRVRTQPNAASTVLGYIQPGEKIEIIGGPVCSNDWIWWQIRSISNNLTGWTAEGDKQNYWLVPSN
jgi:serine/threonine protein kinase